MESGDRYAILTTELIAEANVSVAFAMTPEIAVKTGAGSAVLIVRKPNKQALFGYLRAYQIEVKQVYAHDQPQAVKATKMSYQRLAPLVE